MQLSVRRRCRRDGLPNFLSAQLAVEVAHFVLVVVSFVVVVVVVVFGVVIVKVTSR